MTDDPKKSKIEITFNGRPFDQDETNFSDGSAIVDSAMQRMAERDLLVYGFSAQLLRTLDDDGNERFQRVTPNAVRIDAYRPRYSRLTSMEIAHYGSRFGYGPTIVDAAAAEVEGILDRAGRLAFEAVLEARLGPQPIRRAPEVGARSRELRAAIAMLPDCRAGVMTADSPIDVLLQQTLDTFGELPVYVRPTMRMTTRIEVRPARAPLMPGKRERADRREIVATFEDRSAKLLTQGMFRHEITF